MCVCYGHTQFACFDQCVVLKSWHHAGIRQLLAPVWKFNEDEIHQKTHCAVGIFVGGDFLFYHTFKSHVTRKEQTVSIGDVIFMTKCPASDRSLKN